MAKDGAYSKAVSAVTSEMADLTAEQQAAWATELLPRSLRPEQALFRAANTPTEADVTMGTHHTPPEQDVTMRTDDEQHARADDTRQNAQARGHSGRRTFKHALHCVKFAALSAAGPSGARPEYLKEMLSIRQRSIANKLYKAIGL